MESVVAESKCKVLVVDDTTDIRESLSELLQGEGYEVVEACNGHEALTWVLGHLKERCVILLDLFMPTMKGSEFVRRLNAEIGQDDRLGLSVVFMTASHDDPEATAFKLPLVKKPIEFDPLLALLERLTQEQSVL